MPIRLNVLVVLFFLFLVCCSGGGPVLRDNLLPLADGSVIILTDGNLYRIMPGGTGVTPLFGGKILSVAGVRGGLLTGGMDGRVMLRNPAFPDRRGKVLYEGNSPILGVFAMQDGFAAVTADGIARFRSLSSQDPDGIRAPLTGAAVSLQGHIAWKTEEGLYLAAPGETAGMKVAPDALSFTFIGGDLYWTGKDNRVHYVKSSRSNGILRDFYAPDNSPLLGLGSSPDGLYLFGISEPAKGPANFLSLNLKDGRIFMAPVPEGTTAAAVSADNKFRYYLAGNALHVFGFEQDQKGLIRRIPLREE